MWSGRRGFGVGSWLFDVFWNIFLGISNRRTSKLISFLESWGKTGQDKHAPVWQFYVWRFNLIWPDFDLILTSSWIRRKNGCFHRVSSTSETTRKTCVTTTFTKHFCMTQWKGLCLGIQNHKDFCLCGVPGYAQEQKDHLSVLHMVRRRAVAYNCCRSHFVWTS